MKGRSLPLLGATTTLLSVLGCQPLCRVELPAPQAAWTAWFGPEVGIQRTGFWPNRWRRLVDYRGGTVLVVPVDGAVIANCQPCEPFRQRINQDFGKSLEAALGSQCRSLKVVASRESADYLLMVKVASVREERLFFKLPIGLAGGAHDRFEFWLKLVEARTGRIAFAYRSWSSPVESEEDLRIVAGWVAKTLDQFKKDHG